MKILRFAFIIVLYSISIWRLLLAFRDAYLIDFFHYANHAWAIVHGLDPTDPVNLIWREGSRNWLPAFPGIALLWYPFLLFGNWAGYIFTGFNILLTLIVYPLFLKRAGIRINFNFLQPNQNTLLTALAIFLLINARPFVTGMRLGQAVIPCSMFLLFSLILFSPIRSGISLGIATVYKYSNTVLFILLFCVERKWREVVTVMVVFVIFMLSPALFGQDLRELYGNYVHRILGHFQEIDSEFPPEGLNLKDTYLYGQVDFFPQIHADFFKIKMANFILKTVCFLFFLWICVLLYLKKIHGSLSILLFTSLVSLMIVYHRNHDLTIPVCFLIPLIFHYFSEGQKIFGIICSCFLAYFLIPQQVVLVGLLKWLGQWIPFGTFVYTTVDNSPPMEAIMTALFALTMVPILFYEIRKNKVQKTNRELF